MIDVTSLSSTYAGIANSAGSGSTVEDLASKDLSKASDEELMGACKEFEKYLVEQVFKAMRATVPKSEESSDSTFSMFADTLYQEYASMATESGQFGIAKALYEQMKRTQGSVDNNVVEDKIE